MTRRHLGVQLEYSLGYIGLDYREKVPLMG
jgi:hypothetical protein